MKNTSFLLFKNNESEIKHSELSHKQKCFISLLSTLLSCAYAKYDEHDERNINNFFDSALKLANNALLYYGSYKVMSSNIISEVKAAVLGGLTIKSTGSTVYKFFKTRNIKQTGRITAYANNLEEFETMSTFVATNLAKRFRYTIDLLENSYHGVGLFANFFAEHIIKSIVKKPKISGHKNPIDCMLNYAVPRLENTPRIHLAVDTALFTDERSIIWNTVGILHYSPKMLIHYDSDNNAFRHKLYLPVGTHRKHNITAKEESNNQSYKYPPQIIRSETIAQNSSGYDEYKSSIENIV